ncbi:non-specific lipid transfer protein GPI-anchored 2-like [Oryza brachyantha]|uniref:non-specific lipid transfer protein GPI-anchored 2-like n=1 Tax=Oryza brachyantha TaxID=4533 RepID=UPI001ADBD758|nr:non-specific lipid transfer protein GPI-anchored 2-like [Oryza brachyantha]
MASTTLRLHTALAAVAVAVALALGMAAAQMSPASAPSPAGGITPACMDAVLNMSDCLTYVMNGSTARKPDEPCCPELAGLLDSKPVCLCQLLAGGASSYDISVDYKRALALPGICGLAAPPVSACSLLGVPVPMAPSASPSTGLAPSNEPQMPQKSPNASPSKSSNHAPGRFTAIAALLLAVAAAGMF